MQIDQATALQAGLIFLMGLVSGLAVIKRRATKVLAAQRTTSQKEYLQVQAQWKNLLTQQGRDIASFNKLLRSDLADLRQDLMAVGLSGQERELISSRMVQIEATADVLDEHVEDWIEQWENQPNRPDLLPSLGDKMHVAFHS